MSFLENNILSYDFFDRALKDIEDKVKEVKTNNVAYFYQEKQDDNYLSNYVNSVKELNKSFANFHNAFEDMMMEIEQADFEKWEDEQRKAEQNYYGEFTNGEGVNQ